MEDEMKQILDKLDEMDMQFATDAQVLTPVKAFKFKEEDKEVVKKEGHVILSFFNMLSKQPVARIMLNPHSAKVLANLLTSQVQKLEKQLDTDEIPEMTEATSTIEKPNYMG